MGHSIHSQADYLFQIWILAPLSVIAFLLVILFPVIAYKRMKKANVPYLFEVGLANWALLVALYATIITGGRPLLIIIIPLYAVYLRTRILQDNFSGSITLRKFIVISICGLIAIHFVNSLSLYDPFQGICKVSNGDYDYYTVICGLV